MTVTWLFHNRNMTHEYLANNRDMTHQYEWIRHDSLMTAAWLITCHDCDMTHECGAVIWLRHWWSMRHTTLATTVIRLTSHCGMPPMNESCHSHDMTHSWGMPQWCDSRDCGNEWVMSRDCGNEWVMSLWYRSRVTVVCLFDHQCLSHMTAPWLCDHTDESCTLMSHVSAVTWLIHDRDMTWLHSYLPSRRFRSLPCNHDRVIWLCLMWLCHSLLWHDSIHTFQGERLDHSKWLIHDCDVAWSQWLIHDCDVTWLNSYLPKLGI